MLSSRVCAVAAAHACTVCCIKQTLLKSWPQIATAAGPHGAVPYCRDEDAWLEKVAAALEVPRAMRERQGAFLELDGLPPGMATEMLGMGTWHMRSEWAQQQGCAASLLAPATANAPAFYVKLGFN